MTRAQHPEGAALAIALAGVAVELCVSANLLTWAGIPYVTEGGALPLKLHPATWLLLLAGLCALLQGGRGWLKRLDPLLWVFFAMTGLCLVYILVLTGAGNLIVLLDTFLPAGLLAAVFARAGPVWRARLRRLMQVLLALDAALALAEMAAQATLIPLYLDDHAYHPHREDFRPTALFDHPLTGAIMAMIGLALAPAGRGLALAPGGRGGALAPAGRGGALAPGGRGLKAAYQVLMWGALVAFGGRVAIAVAALAGISVSLWRGARLVLTRDKGAGAVLCAGLGCLLAGALLLAGAFEAGLGDRLAGHLYWDSSAQARLFQWRILDRLDGWQQLFGTRREDLLALLNGLRLQSGVEVLENFWLLMFVSLGAAGFPLFVAGFGALCWWCWRISALPGRVLLASVLIVASTSNSLGRKSTVLVCLVAGIVSVSEAAPARRRVKLVAPAARRRELAA